MIREFRVNNFKSFHEEQVLSFEATKDNLGEGYQVVTMPDGTRLLRFAVVYGANASGKSNLIKALQFVLDFIKGDVDIIKGLEIPVAPFKFIANPARDSSFTLVFYVKGKKYRYSLSVNKEFVSSEKLEVYNTQKPTKLFERTADESTEQIAFNTSLKIDAGRKSDFMKYTLSNTSVFNTLHHIKDSSSRDLDDVYEYFNKTFSKSVKSLKNDPERKDFVINLVKEADFNIDNIIIDEEQIPEEIVNQICESDEAPKSMKRMLRDNPFRTKVMFEHCIQNDNGEDVHSFLPDADESKGTKATVGFSIALYDVLRSNMFLTVDEFEKSFHPEVMKKLIFAFLNADDSESQLLITSHYDPLMDEIDNENLRPDSFWFTEKNAGGSTDLYSLVEFNGINSLKSIRQAYRDGQLGALPNIDI